MTDENKAPEEKPDVEPDSACDEHPKGCPGDSHQEAAQETLETEVESVTVTDKPVALEPGEPLSVDLNSEPEPEQLVDPDAEQDAPGEPTPSPKFKAGDVVLVIGKFVANVVEVFENFEEGVDKFVPPNPHVPVTFSVIVKKGPGYDPDDRHYYMQIANKSREPIAASEGDLELKPVRE
jgi:hypothetical protein